MSTIEHKSTAKASIRSILAAYGKTGTLCLLADVLQEGLPSRRGRPTREERVTRLVLGAIEAILPDVDEAEGRASNPAALLEE